MRINYYCYPGGIPRSESPSCEAPRQPTIYISMNVVCAWYVSWNGWKWLEHTARTLTTFHRPSFWWNYIYRAVGCYPVCTEVNQKWFGLVLGFMWLKRCEKIIQIICKLHFGLIALPKQAMISLQWIAWLPKKFEYLGYNWTFRNNKVFQGKQWRPELYPYICTLHYP